MARRARFVVSTISILAAGAILSGLVLADGPGAGSSAAKKAKGFTPAKLAGKWTGEWKNTTFGSAGEMRVSVQPKAGNKMQFLIDFGGLVFGCTDPAAVPITLSKAKKGPNRWDASGFRFANKPTTAFGSLSITYNFKTKSFKGSGSGPPCRPEIKYTIDATLKPTGFIGNAAIDLGGGTTATSTMTAEKG
jgi:hypothetical protein